MYQFHYCCHTALGTELINSCISNAASTIALHFPLEYKYVIPADDALSHFHLALRMVMAYRRQHLILRITKSFPIW